MGELKRRGNVWWIRYYRDGRRHEESSHSAKKKVAIDLLRTREGDVANGVPVSAQIGRYRFADASSTLLAEYRINNRRSIDEAERRITSHLEPYSGGRRMASITTTDVLAYIDHRQKQGIVAPRGQRKGERIAESATPRSIAS